MKNTIDDATNAEWREADKANHAASVEVAPDRRGDEGGRQMNAEKQRIAIAEAVLFDPQQLENCITFHCGQAHQEIMRLDTDGMTYKGQRIEDGGEAQRAFLAVMFRIAEKALGGTEGRE